MKTIVFAICVFLVSLFFVKDIFGQESTTTMRPDTSAQPLVDSRDTGFEKTPFNKLVRGITNTTFFWLEVPAGMSETAKEENNEFVGASMGLLKGIFTGFLRAVTGIFDTVTFIIPPYKKPLMDPEYVFSRFD